MRVIQQVDLSTICTNRMMLLLPLTSFVGMLLDVLAWIQSNSSVQYSMVELMWNRFLFLFPAGLDCNISGTFIENDIIHEMGGN